MTSPTPPPYLPITPIAVSERWFPRGLSFGLYANQKTGIVAPNVTSILAKEFPFDKSKWVEAEPDLDHDAVTKEAAQRGTAVHLAMEHWLTGHSNDYNPDLAPWVEPLRALVSRGTACLGVEIPLHCSVPGVGRYAGSCDGLMLVGDEVVIIDFKTKRPNKRVSPRFCLKQKLQLCAYSVAISAIYGDQLPGKVSRTSLLFAHPDEGRDPTVVSTSGDELAELEQRWLKLLGDWFAENGEEVERQQQIFNRRQGA